MFPLDTAFPYSVVTIAIAVILIYLEDCARVEGIILAPVYWNFSNPIFKTSKNDHIIVVNLFDEIDFVCPHYPPSIPDSHSHEHYLIHRVSKKEYDDCNIYSDNATFLILRCIHPRKKQRFTILFEPFQSIPNVPEYKAGRTYYFMTTSTGRKSGLYNLYQGACSQHNMKLTIKVRDDDYEGVAPSTERTEFHQHFGDQTLTKHTRHPSKKSDAVATQRNGHSKYDDSAYIVDDIGGATQAFLRPGTQPTPSSRQAFWTGNARSVAPSGLLQFETRFLLTALVTIAFALDRWSHVQIISS